MNSALIVRLGALGDVIHGIPVVGALRAAFPDAVVDWMVDPRYVEIAKLVKGVSACMPVDPRVLLSRRRGELIRTLQRARARRYDVALDLQGLVKSAALARFCRARRTIGFSRAHLREPLARLFYTDTVDPASAAHVIEKNLALVAALGVSAPRVTFPLDIPAAPAAPFGGSGYVVLNPGAAWPNKRWPADRFGAVARAVREEHGFRSLVIWGPGERALADAVVHASDGAAEVSPPTTIVELFAVARDARVLISGDTGPMHIGAAVGTPLVGLFGPTRPERNGPWDPRDVVVSRAGHCVCHYERSCRRPVPCIDDISVADVVAAVRRRLTPHTEGARGA